MNQEVKQINNKKVKKQLSFSPYVDFLDFFKRLCLHVHIDIVNGTFFWLFAAKHTLIFGFAVKTMYGFT